MTTTTPLSAFAPPLVSTLTLFLLFLYLHLVHRERYLAIWTAAWGLWLLRMAYAAFGPGMSFGSSDPLPRVLAMSYIIVLGLGWAWAGLWFAHSDARLGRERWIPAAALMLMGVHQWSIPIIQNFPGYTPWALSITLSLQIGIGVGVLVAFNQRARVRLTEAHTKLESALTNALAGHIPICAHCKSMRDERNHWRRLEAYLMSRTEAQLSHGICPDCATQHFPGM